MTAYNDNPAVTGDYIWITADDTAGRRSRAAQVNAGKRAYEREHGVTLTLLHKSYSETWGFLHRSSFRYKIARPLCEVDDCCQGARSCSCGNAHCADHPHIPTS